MSSKVKRSSINRKKESSLEDVQHLGKSNALEVEKMKSAMEQKKSLTSFSGISSATSIPHISNQQTGTTTEAESGVVDEEGSAIGGKGGGVSQGNSLPNPNGTGDDPVTSETSEGSTPEHSSASIDPSTVTSASGPAVNKSNTESGADVTSAADVNFGQDIVNGTSKTPSPSMPQNGTGVQNTPSQTPNPSTPDTGSEVDVPSTTTPTPSTPSYDDNRAPSVRSMWMQNNRVPWNGNAAIDINGSDPNWDPLSWKLEWSGTNGFSHEEEIGFPDTDKPTINNWIQTDLPLENTGLRKYDKLTCTATAFDPGGLSGTDSFVIEISNAPPEIKSVTTDKSEYLMTDVAKVEIVAEDMDKDDLYWTYNWAGFDASGSGTDGPGDILTIEVDINEAQALPGEEVFGFAEVNDMYGGKDSENFSLPVIDIENQIDEIGAAEVWFTNGAAQDANIGYNDPPQIDMLRLSKSAILPGQDVDITGRASDPENMDLTWSWSWSGRGVNEAGTAAGNNISLPNMSTSKNAKPDSDKYTFTAKVNDGMLDSKSESIKLDIKSLPPVIESLSLPSRVEEGDSVTLTAEGNDPMGANNLLDWNINTNGVLNGDNSFTNQENISNRYSNLRDGSGTANVTLTNDAGLTDTASATIRVDEEQQQDDGDPLIFDLNRDGQMDVVGGEQVSNGISMPAGEWQISVTNGGQEKNRYIINNANQGNGPHRTHNNNTVSIHATSKWKLGLEQRSNGNWGKLDVSNTPSFELDKNTTNGSGSTKIKGGGTTLNAVRTSDLGYGDNEMGVNQVGGEEVLFDLDPNSWSWSHGHADLRPGLHNNDEVPRVPNGKAVYDTGKKDNIPNSGAWIENPSKGSSAKIYNASGEWVAEWVGGEEPMYYYGTRDDRERTQWMAGTGDGMLVWDHNNDGIISDGTELMSEFDAEGNVAFADGWEKLSHYFDTDGDGIIKGSELNGLKMWVDDGDAKTEAGELMELADYGIFSIEIPQNGSWSSSVQTLGMNSVAELGFMAVLTRSPTNGEMNNYVGQLTTGLSIKAFITELLNSSEFTNDIMSQGVNDVVYDMIKNLLHKRPSAEEVNTGVSSFESDRADYVISLMNDPTVIERFEADNS